VSIRSGQEKIVASCDLFYVHGRCEYMQWHAGRRGSRRQAKEGKVPLATDYKTDYKASEVHITSLLYIRSEKSIYYL
jgi:hypothetical protein